MIFLLHFRPFIRSSISLLLLLIISTSLHLFVPPFLVFIVFPPFSSTYLYHHFFYLLFFLLLSLHLSVSPLLFLFIALVLHFLVIPFPFYHISALLSPPLIHSTISQFYHTLLYFLPSSCLSSLPRLSALSLAPNILTFMV